MSTPKDRMRSLEAEWSDASRKQGAKGVVLVNDVDDDLPSIPPSFRWYESDYPCKSEHVPDPSDYDLYCEGCSPCGIGDPCECIKSIDSAFDGAYDCGYLRDELIDCRHGFVIRECNSICHSGKKCLNKASQAPRRWIPEIFKTDNGRGWGVRSKVKLGRGEILGIYTGDLLAPTDDIEDPSAKYINEGNPSDRDIRVNYIFALDGYTDRDDNTAWSVDAYSAGNWTRFANHSCNPNMRIYSRSLGEFTPDVSLSCSLSTQQELLYLVLVAKDDIPAGTELTFDYRPGAVDTAGEQGRNDCLCGAYNCRGRLWT